MDHLSVGNFEKIASGIYLEGLAVDDRRDVVWYSDVIAGGIHGVKYDGTKVLSFNETRMWTGGVMLNDDGCVFSSGEGGIMWNDPDSGKSGWLIDKIDGIPINGVNEMVSDGAGGIFFGTSDIEMIIKGKPTRPSGLYHLTVDFELTKILEIGFPNGIMFDAGRGRFYCNDTFNCSWVFDVHRDLSFTNKRELLAKQDVDGMALDAEGNIWITGIRSNFLTRVTPDGSALPSVATPAGSITQIRFGGVDMRDYYINSVPADGGDTLKVGGTLPEAASHLFRGRSEVPGMKLSPGRFKLR